MIKAITAENICKSFSKTKALKDISLEVDEGELFGLIGPDGAGKTTLIRILITLILADQGSARILGHDVVKDYKKIRSMIGYMPGKFSLYQDLTVEENLKLFASVFGTTINENYDLVKDIYSQIEPFKNRPAGQLSGGMKQKLALSCALIHKPDVLFLDEPTTGIDPVSRHELWEMLKSLKKQGITIFVSTAYMDEANKCDRIALIQNGSLLAIDNVEHILHKFDKKLLAINSDSKSKLLKDLRKYEFCDKVYPFGEYVHYVDKRKQFNEENLTEYIQKLNHTDIDVKKEIPNIEDCFIDLMSGEKHE